MSCQSQMGIGCVGAAHAALSTARENVTETSPAAPPYQSLTPSAAGTPMVTPTAYTRSSQNMDPRAPR
jgi:hypothetical protein